MSEEREPYGENLQTQDQYSGNSEAGISPVAGGSDSTKKMVGGGIVAIGAIAIAAMAMFSGGEDEVVEEQAVVEEEFSRPSNSPPPEPPPLPKIDLTRPTTVTVTPQVASAQARERAQARKDAEAKKQARLRSPMLVLDEGGRGGSGARSNAPLSRGEQLAQQEQQLRNQLAAIQSGQFSGNAGGGLDPFAGGAGGGGVSDNEGFAQRNNQFAANTASAPVDTAQAYQLSNLSYRINQGKMIRGVLETAIQSDLPGMLRAIVAEDVYSANGRNLLLPRGSRLVGEYRSGLVQGQTRVFVVWNRLIRPDGVDVALGSRGTDSLGRAGLGGVVDTHFIKRFGGALLLSMIGSSVEAAQRDSTVIVNTSESFSDAAEVALENTINIPPTIHVDQGTPIQVFVSRDLDFTTVLAAN